MPFLNGNWNLIFPSFISIIAPIVLRKGLPRIIGHVGLQSITTREKPSSSAGFWPISSAGKRANDKALQLKLSSSADWHALLIYLLSSSAFHANRYC